MSALRLWRPDDEASASSSPPFRFESATVRQVLDWFIQHNPKPSTSEISSQEMRRVWALFADKLGSMLCTACRPHMLLEFITAQPRIRSNWTRKRWNVTIQHPFNVAAKLRLIEYNPFHGVSFPAGGEGRDWTDDEYRTMLRASTPEFRRLLVFLRFTGVRPGESRNLRWENIRRQISAIVIDRDEVKTDVTRRIPLTKVTSKLLAWLRRRSKSDYVFVNSFGGPWTMNAVCKRLRELRRRLGLSEKVKLHGGRHYFGTHAVMNATDLATLAQLMGHASVATTKKYVHLADKIDHLQSAMEKAVKSTLSTNPGGSSSRID